MTPDHPASLFLLICSSVVLVFWIALRTNPRRRWSSQLFLGPSGERAPAAPGRVVAVVPARDEADMLPATLPALLSQSPIDLVVLVDDRSADGTARVAAEVAGEAGTGEKLLVVSTGEAPRPGWSGKVNALARGVEAASADGRDAAEWLLFTDADILHRAGSVEDLLSTALRERRDLVSVMARLHAGGLWERLLVPPFVFFFHLLYPFRSVRDDLSRVAAAAGGCVLVRRNALDRAGGLAAISGALIDDVALAKAVKGTGGRLWLGLDPGIRSQRPYGDLASLWRMISRCAFTQLRHSYVLLAAVVAGLAVFFVSPPVLALAAVITGALQLSASGALDGAVPVAGAAAVLAWGLQTAGLAPWARHHGVHPIWAAALPVASAFYGLMTISSAWRHARGRGVAWKGRRYGG